MLSTEAPGPKVKPFLLSEKYYVTTWSSAHDSVHHKKAKNGINSYLQRLNWNPQEAEKRLLYCSEIQPESAGGTCRMCALRVSFDASCSGMLPSESAECWRAKETFLPFFLFLPALGKSWKCSGPHCRGIFRRSFKTLLFRSFPCTKMQLFCLLLYAHS